MEDSNPNPNQNSIPRFNPNPDAGSSPASSAPASTDSGNFITIVEEDEFFPWQYTDPQTGKKLATVFSLRIVPETIQTRLRKKYTKTSFKRGQRIEVVNWTKQTHECLNFAVGDIQGLTASRIVGDQRQTVPIDFAALDPAARARTIYLLPERVKAEMVRLCIGREMAMPGDDDDEAEDETEGAGGND